MALLRQKQNSIFKSGVEGASVSLFELLFSNDVLYRNKPMAAKSYSQVHSQATLETLAHIIKP